MKTLIREINKRAPALEYTSSLHEDLRRLQAWIKSGPNAIMFHTLQVPLLNRSILSFATDWILIFASVSAVFVTPWLLPLALLIIGARQRALANIRHDASHGNLFKNRRVNDLITDLFGSLAMFETVRFYREGHVLHHKYLGLNSHDPDAENHVRYGVDDSSSEVTKPLRKYTRLFFSLRTIPDSIGKSFMEITARERVKVVLWWTTVCSALVLLINIHFSVLFFGLWMLARATTYHAIRVFAEFLDHSGLKPGSNVGFTRVLPQRNLLACFVNPHDDAFHLTHHLFPQVPHYNLSKLHRILLENPEYRSGHHCDSYFLGKHPAWKCWVGQCSEAIQ